MKIAIITGAGSGIGKSTALALLNEGYTVVLAGRKQEQLQTTINAAGPLGKFAVAIPTDITKPNDVRHLFAQVKAQFGRLDLLFNNAGTNVPGLLLEEITIEQWNTVLATNLTGSFLCTQEAFKMMKNQNPQGGRIINNGSISAHVPRPNSAPYTATKHAMTGLTKSTTLDGRKYNIVCSQIDIGNALTDMAKKMPSGVLQADGTIAIEPVIDVAHVAATIVHLANLPLDVNMPFVTIMASKMPYAGRG
ncbi:MAG: SDR family oxidoreductase [Saprospiraceae bacterium]